MRTTRLTRIPTGENEQRGKSAQQGRRKMMNKRTSCVDHSSHTRRRQQQGKAAEKQAGSSMTSASGRKELHPPFGKARRVS